MSLREAPTGASASLLRPGMAEHKGYGHQGRVARAP